MIWWISCVQQPVDSDTHQSETEQIREEFSVILLADPHVAGEGEHQERLQRTVAWINAHKEEQGIAMAVVLGDVGWGEGLVLAHEALDELEVPYLPVIGDNEVHFGDEERFFSVFSDAYNHASQWCSDWHDSLRPVWNPEFERNSTFGNFSCLFGGIRFVGLDWASRHSGSILGEMGDLHNFSEGSFDWLRTELSLHEADYRPIVLLSHIPMYVNGGAFDIYEMEDLESLLASYSDRLTLNFAGHYHSDSEHELSLYDLVVVDAIWDDVIRFQKLTITTIGEQVFFSHELMTID
jgi:hypothetical protein